MYACRYTLLVACNTQDEKPVNLQNVFPDIPPQIWPALESLAAVDWVVPRKDDTGHLDIAFAFHRITDPTARRYAEAAYGGAYESYGGPKKAVIWLYAVSRLIAEGPKVFRPTTEQCQAMEHVELRLPMSQYRQAFPTMLVEFPREYLETVKARLGPASPTPPRFVVARNWTDPAPGLFTGCSITDTSGESAELVFIFGGTESVVSMENAIRVTANPDPGETALNEMLTRVTVNLMLLLSQAHTRVVPSDPAGLSKAKHNLTRGIKPELQRREISRHVSLIIPDREVVVRKTRRIGVDLAEGQPPATDPIATHWVRGHWRAFPGHGEARARGEQVPLVFVSPYLVIGEGTAPAPAYSVV